MVNYDLLDAYIAKFKTTFTVVAVIDNPKLNDLLQKAIDTNKPLSDRDFGFTGKPAEGETNF